MMEIPQERKRCELGLGGKTRSFDGDKGAVFVDSAARIASGLVELGGEIRAKGIGSADMGHQSLSEEGTFALASKIDHLVGDDEFTGFEILAQRAARADADHVRYAQGFERVDIGAIVDLTWQNVMADAVASQESDPRLAQAADHNGGGWPAKRGVQVERFYVCQAFETIQA